MDDKLLAAVDQLCDPSSTQAEWQVHFATVVEFVPARASLEALVKGIGHYLTNTDGAVRRRCTQMLAGVIARGAVIIDVAMATNLCDFFCGRLGDYPSVPACFAALDALFRKYPHSVNGTSAATVSAAIFKELHVPALEQRLRQACFRLLSYFIHTPALCTGLAANAVDFAAGFVQAMEGEKDPRCLLVSLGIVKAMLHAFGQEIGPLIEEVFDVTSCYFPVTFTPPPNDPHRITKESLVDALRDVFTARPEMAPLVIPLLLEKLSSSLLNAKLDSLETMQVCARAWGVQALSTAGASGGEEASLRAVRDALRNEVVNSQEPEVLAAATATVTAITAVIAAAREQTGSVKEWNQFSGPLLEWCATNLATSPEKLAGQGAVKILEALARASPFTLSRVLEVIMPVIKASMQQAECSQRVVYLKAVIGLVQAVDCRLDHPKGTHPLTPFVDDIIDIIVPTAQALKGSAGGCAPLASLVSSATGNAAAGGGAGAGAGAGGVRGLPGVYPADGPGPRWDVRCSAVRCMHRLATCSPTPLLSDALAEAFVQHLTALLLHDMVPAVRRAALAALVGMAQTRQPYADSVLKHTLPPLMGVVPASPGCLSSPKADRAKAAAAAVTDASPAAASVLAATGMTSPHTGVTGSVDVVLTVDEAFNALSALCAVCALFKVAVPGLLRRAVEALRSDEDDFEYGIVFSRAKGGAVAERIMATLARIVREQETCMPCLDSCVGDKLKAEVDVLGGADKGTLALLPTLLAILLHSSDPKEVAAGVPAPSQALWDNIRSIFTVIARGASAEAQTILRTGTVGLYLGDHHKDKKAACCSCTLPYFAPLTASACGRQLRMLDLLTVVVGNGSRDVPVPQLPRLARALAKFVSDVAVEGTALESAALVRSAKERVPPGSAGSGGGSGGGDSSGAGASAGAGAGAGAGSSGSQPLPKLHLPRVREAMQGATTERELELVCAVRAACECMAALVNRAPAGAEFTNLSSELSQRLTELTDALVACDSGAKPFQKRLGITALAWLAKGLVMRGAIATDLLSKIATLSTPSKDACKRSEDMLVWYHAGHCLGTVVADVEHILNKQSGATVSVLYKQRVYHELREKVITPPIVCADGNICMPRLMAVCSLVANLPPSLVLHNMMQVLPAILAGLGVHCDWLSCSALTTFEMIVRADVEVVSPHILTVVPHLLGLSTRKHRATIRGRALDALRGLTVLPYHKLFPVKKQVVAGLKPALDDKSRAVRRRAVMCRNDWLSLST